MGETAKTGGHSEDSELLKQKIGDLDREKQQILSLISHDIKAPLNRVFALVQLMYLEDSNLTPDQHGYIDKMHLVVADGLGMIRNLVDYRNLEYRRIEVVPEEIKVSQLIQLVIRNFSPIAAKKKITIDADLSSEVQIISDNNCLIRAIENLISNAVKFSQEGAKVIVAIRHERDSVQISIQDQAKGFTMEDQKNLYKKFQKLTAHPTGGESTTGLGLFIAKSMLEKIHGKISCATLEGIGSTFTVTLPMKI